jgi:oxygen-independent coproporphyrinogen-3 oxidase
MRSLYVHFPFCESKCHYCDFYSIGAERTADSDPFLFETSLTEECRQAVSGRKLSEGMTHSVLNDRIDTIFFGGGTPSMTPPESMARALEPLGLNRRVHAGTEWTMEANPSSVDRKRLEDYRAIGVNRISMGVQALRPDLLTALGRVHSRDAAFRALDAIFEAGFTNVSVDLLCGVPNQSPADVEKAMEELTRYPITHLSCYLLTLPKSHRMSKLLPNEDEQLEHLLTIDRYMTAAGFEHYEISNFAKPGHQARHNLAYWTGSSYLGLGPSAHSFDASIGARWKNFSSLHRYASTLAKGGSVIEWSESLSGEQKEMEKWMLALRLAEGFPREWLDTEGRRKKAETLQERGLMMEHPHASDKLRLTPRGFALSDQIISLLSG